MVNPFFQLVTAADLRAMAWIRQNTPADAVFLANSERAYGGRTVVGTDAGWWLPLLAGRRGTVPVMLYLDEGSSPPGLAQRTNDLEETVRTRGPTSAEGLAALRQAGVTHVFVGARGGYLKAEGWLGGPRAYRGALSRGPGVSEATDPAASAVPFAKGLGLASLPPEPRPSTAIRADCGRPTLVRACGRYPLVV